MAQDQNRVLTDGSAREPAHKLVRVLETGEANARVEAPSVLAKVPDGALRLTRDVRSKDAAARLLLLLHATPLLGVAGVIALYWSSDGPRDIMFAVGMLLLLSAVAAFQHLRSRLVARLSLRALREGVPHRQARKDAERAADELIGASLLRSRAEDPLSSARVGCIDGETRASRWPPISLS